MPDLKDTPFAADRLLVWAVAFSVMISILGAIALSFLDKPVPPILEDTIKVGLGALAMGMSGLAKNATGK